MSRLSVLCYSGLLLLMSLFESQSACGQFRIEKVESRVGSWKITKDTIFLDSEAPSKLRQVIKEVTALGDDLLENTGPVDDDDSVSSFLEFRLTRFDSLFSGWWSVDRLGTAVHRDVQGVNYRLKDAKTIRLRTYWNSELAERIRRQILSDYPAMIDPPLPTLENLQSRFVIEGSHYCFLVPFTGNGFVEVSVPIDYESSRRTKEIGK